MTTDSELIRRSGESPHAFTAPYDQYARMIHRYAARRAGESAAEDVMAEAYSDGTERIAEQLDAAAAADYGRAPVAT